MSPENIEKLKEIILSYLIEELNNMKGDEVVSIMWRAASDSKTAFMEEYALQTIRGVGNTSTYNKIWSPGKKLFESLGGK